MIKRILFCFFLTSTLHAQTSDSITRSAHLSDQEIFGVSSEPVQRQSKEFDFCRRIRLRLISIIGDKLTINHYHDSIAKVHAVEDSIFYAMEKIRCAREKDSIKLAQLCQGKEDSVKPVELNGFTRMPQKWSLHQSKTNGEITELENNTSQYPYKIHIGDYESWGIIRDTFYTLDPGTKVILDSLVNRLAPINTKSFGLKVNPELSRLIPGNTKEDTGNGNIEFSFYPNPASSFITINSNREGKLELLDMNGKVVLNQMIPDGTSYLDIQELGIGYYFLCLGTQRVKLLIAR